MEEDKKSIILCVDSEKETLNFLVGILTGSGYRVIAANNVKKALPLLEQIKPGLILFGITMPEIDSNEFLSEIKEKKELSYIPVVFLTDIISEQDKKRIFMAGATGSFTTAEKNRLLYVIQKYLDEKISRSVLERGYTPIYLSRFAPDFIKFKEFAALELNIPPEKGNIFTAISVNQLYNEINELGITTKDVAKLIAEFLNLQYMPFIDPEVVKLGVFPFPFCKKNLIVPLNDPATIYTFVLSNPFDLGLMDLIKRCPGISEPVQFFVTEPESILSFFEEDSGVKKITVSKGKKSTQAPPAEKNKIALEHLIETHPVVYTTNNILSSALEERASDIHFEPKDKNIMVRFRVDGEMKNIMNLTKEMGTMAISRFKILADLDIAERRKPQDGAFEAAISGRRFRLRLATTSTPYGESLIIRLLEPYSRPKDFGQLGMTDEQSKFMINLAKRTQGLILVVGPTGSGKTTTIYSLLGNIDCKKRSLISVEDPVEYTIPYANQQQVNDKAGITFESLLKSSVRQDPDILFIGEIRDPYSGKIAFDFASTGHITVSSLHTTNATTAIFRLEKVGISRETMADTLICVVAQRLLKKLCPYCKKTEFISEEEINMLSTIALDIPIEVAHPVGCTKCNNTGYFGREGIFEIINIDREISEMIRSGEAIPTIREFCWNRGDYLISHHTIDKIKQLVISPKEAYERVLVDESNLMKSQSIGTAMPNGVTQIREAQSVLVVDDDKDARLQFALILEDSGYHVTTADDSLVALNYLNNSKFDLIISEVKMANMDGFKLMELILQKGINTPVVFVASSGREEDEIRGLKLGAMDYIKKPVQKDILLLRIDKVLKKVENKEKSRSIEKS